MLAASITKGLCDACVYTKGQPASSQTQCNMQQCKAIWTWTKLLKWNFRYGIDFDQKPNSPDITILVSHWTGDGNGHCVSHEVSHRVGLRVSHWVRHEWWVGDNHQNLAHSFHDDDYDPHSIKITRWSWWWLPSTFPPWQNPTIHEKYYWG